MNDPFTENTLIFDLDGLILDSLPRLSNAFVDVVFGLLNDHLLMDKFVIFDKNNSGLSRFSKIDFALDLADIDRDKRNGIRINCLEKFNTLSLQARCESEIDEFIFKFAGLIEKKVKLILLSNCDEVQLKYVVFHHKLSSVFGKNFYGTPPSKDIVFASLLNHDLTNKKSIYSISDSKSDMEIASENGVNFVFIKRFARDLTFDLCSNALEFNKLENFHNFYFSRLINI